MARILRYPEIQASKCRSMSDEPTIDLTLIGRQLRQLLTDVAGMRDDMGVLTAIAMRQDGALSALLTEVRAMHSQIRAPARRPIAC